MKSIVSLSTKILTTTFAFALSVSCATANVLREVQINSVDGGYGIVLKTDEAAQMKKLINSNNKISIELKNVDLSSDLNTVYNDVTNIDNVTIQPLSKKDVKITLSGEDIANSKIYFETPQNISMGLNANPEQESIQLNAPISSYTPVYTPEMFDEPVVEAQTSSPELNEVLTKMHISKSMLLVAKKYVKSAINKFENIGINSLTLFGMIVVIFAFALRPRAKKGSKSKSSGVGLSSTQNKNNIDREIALNQDMMLRMNNSLKGAEPKGINGLTTSSYGMRAYQQSQKNPYVTQAVQPTGISGIPRRTLSSEPIKKQPIASQLVSNVARKTSSVVSQPKLQLANNPLNKTPLKTTPTSQEADLDSMKFLESITKIYEKNGRSDLAKGLKDNLRKAQLAKI